MLLFLKHNIKGEEHSLLLFTAMTGKSPQVGTHKYRSTQSDEAKMAWENTKN